MKHNGYQFHLKKNDEKKNFYLLFNLMRFTKFQKEQIEALYLKAICTIIQLNKMIYGSKEMIKELFLRISRAISICKEIIVSTQRVKQFLSRKLKNSFYWHGFLNIFTIHDVGLKELTKNKLLEKSNLDSC